MARQIEEIILKVRIDDRNALKTVGSASGAFERADSNAKSFNKSLIKIAGSLLAVAGGIRAIGKASDTALSFQKVENSLISVLGTSERVNQEWQFLSRIADTLGLDVLKLSEDFAKIAAASNGTSIEGKGARDVLVGVSAAATALSLSADDASGALRAINQIISKGKVQAEELRGQLGERIPGAFQIAARAMNVTTQELNDMLEAGELLSEDFIPKFSQQLKNEFAGGALQAANKETAALNRITNELNETYRQFGVVANSFIPILAETIIPAVTDSMESLLSTSLDYAEQVLPEILTIASGVFEGMGTLFSSLGEVVATVFDFIASGWNLIFTQITGDENWIDQITGFLTVAARAWPQLIANAFLTVGKTISQVLSGIEETFFSIIDTLTIGILKLQNSIPEELAKAGESGLFGVAGQFISGARTTDEELRDAINQVEKDAAERGAKLGFFDELAKEQQRLIDRNNETIQDFADSVEEDRAENRKSVRDFVGDLRKKLTNVFNVADVNFKRTRSRSNQRQVTKDKGVSLDPVTTQFQVGTSEASKFLQATRLNEERNELLKQIAKATKKAATQPPVTLVSKSGSTGSALAGAGAAAGVG